MIQRSEDLQEANRKLRDVVDGATDAFVGMDEGGRITDWNRQATATFGWPCEDVLGRDLADTIIPVQHRVAHRAGLARFLATGDAHILNDRLEMVAIDRDGREFPVELSVRAVAVGSDAVGFHAFVRDISERRAYQDALRESDAKHHLLAEQLAAAQQMARLGSWDWEIAANRVTWSDELCRIFGVDPENFVGTYQGFLDRIHPEDRELAESAITGAFASGSEYALDYRLVRADGAVVWVHSRGQVEVGADGAPVRMSGTAADVTERVSLQQELTALALFDELTGLHNRRGFVTLANHQLRVARRAGHAVALLFIDIDGMKSINDTYGHSEGDRALGDVAKFLRMSLRASDLVARIGGDEFCVLLVDAGGPTTDVERAMAKLRPGPPQGQRSYTMSLSVGVGWFEPKSGTSIEDLMSRADTAMYKNRSSQREQACASEVEAATERDRAGQQRDHTADRRDQASQERDQTGRKRDRAGDRRDREAHQRDQTSEERDEVAEKRDQASQQRDRSADQRDQTGHQRDQAAVTRDLAAEQAESGLGPRITTEALDRSSLARDEAASDRDAASQDRRSGAKERAEADRDRDSAAADRGAGADERAETAHDRGTGRRWQETPVLPD